jgi:hypothetical protein
MPARRTRWMPCPITIRAQVWRSSTVPTWTKSAAMVPLAYAVRNCFQVGPAWRGAGPIPASCRICHNGGGCDLVAEPDQFALHPPVPPRGVLRRDADHEHQRAYPRCLVDAMATTCKSSSVVTAHGAMPSASKREGSASSLSSVLSTSAVTPPWVTAATGQACQKGWQETPAFVHPPTVRTRRGSG